jgi:dihydropteroate synthase
MDKSMKIMGIVNITPDSFSGDGSLLEKAIYHAIAQANEGADILDLGAESTRPGAIPLTPEEEWARLKPVLQGIRAVLPTIPLSIDSYKPEIIARAIPYGIQMINDIWGGRDPAMLALAKQYQLPIVLMHNSSSKATHTPVGAVYDGEAKADFMAWLCGELAMIRDRALVAGLEREQIILDPGLGFGKTLEQNLMIIKHVSLLNALGCPILLAPSRKSFIGRVLHEGDSKNPQIGMQMRGKKEVSKRKCTYWYMRLASVFFDKQDAPEMGVLRRDWGTAACVAYAVHTASFIRVHEVAGIRDMLLMRRAIEHAG